MRESMYTLQYNRQATKYQLALVLFSCCDIQSVISNHNHKVVLPIMCCKPEVTLKGFYFRKLIGKDAISHNSLKLLLILYYSLVKSCALVVHF